MEFKIYDEVSILINEEKYKGKLKMNYELLHNTNIIKMVIILLKHIHLEFCCVLYYGS